MAKASSVPLRGITYRDAIREALYQLMKKDKRIFLIGEGVDDAPGIFGTTKGFAKEFGKSRALDIPVAENAMTGIALGASLCGMKPVFIHMRMDFLPMAMDQIVNHAAKWSYMFGGAAKTPIVIRSIIGRGWGSAAQHSQSLQALFMHVPGLRVVMPSTPYDVKGLLVESLRVGEPVMFIEHRWLYDHLGHVPENLYTIPFGEGIVRKKGKDVTVVGISYMCFEALKAQESLARDNIDIEVIDPRTLNPLDETMIFDSVKKTGRLVVADTGWTDCGAASDISARVTEKCFRYLKAPIIRIGLKSCPTPASHSLEKEFYSCAKDIVHSVKSLISE